MKLEFKVVVTIDKIEPQNQQQFESQDGKAMRSYIKECITERLKSAWQYNAMVKKVEVTKPKY